MNPSASHPAWKNLLQLGAAQAISMLLSLVMKVYLPRLLGLEKAGMIFFAESVICLYFSFLPLGIGVYIFREVPKNPDAARHMIRPILLVETLLFLVLTSALILQLHLQGKDNDTLRFVAIFALSQYLGLLCFQIFKPIYLSLHKAGFVALLDTLSKALLAAISVGCVLIVPSLTVLAWGLVAGMLITFAIYLRRVVKDGFWGGQFNRAFVQDTIVKPLPFFIHGALVSVYIYMDGTILGLLADASETGLYGAAVRLLGIFLLFVPLVASSTMPVLSRLLQSDPEAYRHLLQQTLRVILTLSGLLVFPLVLFADEILALLYGPAFAKSASALRLLSPTLILTYSNIILSQHLTLASNGRKLILATIISIGLDLALNNILIPWSFRHWGAGGSGMGVALTNVISEGIVFLAYCYLSSQHLPSLVMVRRMAALFVPLLILILILQDHPQAFWIRAILAFVFTPFYLFALGFIQTRDFLFLKNQLKKH